MRMGFDFGAGERRLADVTRRVAAMSVGDSADTVAEQLPGPAQIEHLENSRVEAPERYNVVHTGLEKLELKPQLLSATLIESMFGIVEASKHRVEVDKPYPEVRWTASSNT